MEPQKCGGCWDYETEGQGLQGILLEAHPMSVLFSPLKQSMQVPQTPLHTSRVLKEEKDLWEDVKVKSLNCFCP